MKSNMVFKESKPWPIENPYEGIKPKQKESRPSKAERDAGRARNSELLELQDEIEELKAERARQQSMGKDKLVAEYDERIAAAESAIDKGEEVITPEGEGVKKREQRLKTEKESMELAKVNALVDAESRRVAAEKRNNRRLEAVALPNEKPLLFEAKGTSGEMDMGRVTEAIDYAELDEELPVPVVASSEEERNDELTKEEGESSDTEGLYAASSRKVRKAILADAMQKVDQAYDRTFPKKKSKEDDFEELDSADLIPDKTEIRKVA
jgi:hypothetical protein